MTSTYIEILNSQLMLSLQKFDSKALGIVFQLDNDPKHTAKVSQK